MKWSSAKSRAGARKHIGHRGFFSNDKHQTVCGILAAVADDDPANGAVFKAKIGSMDLYFKFFQPMEGTYDT